MPAWRSCFHHVLHFASDGGVVGVMGNHALSCLRQKSSPHRMVAAAKTTSTGATRRLCSDGRSAATARRKALSYYSISHLYGSGVGSNTLDTPHYRYFSSTSSTIRKRSSNKESKRSAAAVIRNGHDQQRDQERQRWDDMFQRLLRYKRQHNGSTLVPQTYKVDLQLGRWVKNQRSHYKSKTLTDDQILLLESVGFWWDARDGQWQECFEALLAYKQEHNGSTLVPKRYTPNPKLAHWVGTQRQFYKQNVLSQERIDRLNEIGFVWDPLERSWDDMFQQWIATKKRTMNKDHRNHEVDREDDTENDNDDDYESTPSSSQSVSSTKLQDWVDVQRLYYVEGKLNESRRQRLLDAGFEFEPRNTSWWQSYSNLKQYWEQHGHTNIPYQYEDDASLGRWVHTQRAAYKRKRLSQDRMDALDELDFSWEIRNRQKTENT